MKRLPIFAALGAMLVPAAASAQERLELSSIPNLSVYEATLPLGVRWKRHRKSTKSATGAAWSLGAGVGRGEDISGGIGAGTLALGYRSRATLVGLRGELTGLLPTEGEPVDTNELRGRYRATAIAHLAPKSDRGLNLALDGWLRHTGRTAFRLDAPRFGSAPMATGGGTATVLLRVGEDDDDMSFAVPVRYRAERTRWTDGGAIRQADTQAVGMGIAMQPGERDAVRGTLDMLRGTVEHTRLQPRVTGASMLPEAGGESGVAARFRKVTLGSGATDLTFYDRKIMGTFNMRVGWSWLEADVGSETLKDNAFDVLMGANLKFGKPNDSGSVGFAVSRDPNRSADGSRLVSDTRLELSSDYESKSTEIAVRGAMSWLHSLEGAPTNEGGDHSILRYGTHLEAFYKLPLSFQAGAYLATSFEPHGASDPWATKRSLNTEAGLLLRWRRPAVAPPKPIVDYHHHHTMPDKRVPLRRPIEVY